VYTREQLPQDWARTQNNLGPALRALAERSAGPQAAAYLEQSVTASRSALEVRTEGNFPFQWTQTMRNLALLYEQKQDWVNARETYTKLLHHDPENPRFRAKLEELSNRQ
jgi:tetratricopeptide (TPR) repeat protein